MSPDIVLTVAVVFARGRSSASPPGTPGDLTRFATTVATQPSERLISHRHTLAPVKPPPSGDGQAVEAPDGELVRPSDVRLEALEDLVCNAIIHRRSPRACRRCPVAVER